MIGTFVNAGMILIGSIAGSVLKKGIKDKYKEALFLAMGLAATGLGINSIVQNMPNSEYPVLFIVSLAIGSLFGTILDIDGKFHKLVNRFSTKGKLAQGLSTGILLFCIGTLSILGPINAALYKDYTFLFTNATLDLVTSTVLALFLGNFMSASLMCEISIVGGFLIFCSGISILEIKNIKTLNLLPSLLVPVLFFIILALIC